MARHENDYGFFDLKEFDAEFSSRTTPDDWARTLEMRSHNNFINAVLNYHLALPALIRGKPVLKKVVSEVWRYEMLAYILYLYDTRDADQPRSGLTLTNLERMCRNQNCASPGRVRAIVGYLWATGYLRRQKSLSDNRITQFAPTSKLVGFIEDWTQGIFKSIDEIVPDGCLAERHLSDPRFGWDMRKGCTEQLLTGWKPFGLFPEVFHFIQRDAGWMVLLHCVGQVMRVGKGEIVPISVDLAGFGALFGVSRSHLRRVLETAFDERLLDVPPSNGRHIVLSRKLIAAYFSSMAAELEFYRFHANNSTAALTANS
jgi:hypothetical protein